VAKKNIDRITGKAGLKKNVIPPERNKFPRSLRPAPIYRGEESVLHINFEISPLPPGRDQGVFVRHDNIFVNQYVMSVVR
jgi:hypothetical protein